jgi:short-subunit dehydrogenase
MSCLTDFSPNYNSAKIHFASKCKNSHEENPTHLLIRRPTATPSSLLRDFDSEIYCSTYSLDDTMLAGKTVVITGGSSGIGRSLAKLVVSKGGKAILAARNEDKLAEALKEIGVPNSSFAVRCDVTKREDHKKLLQTAVERFGAVDVYVNNAGVGMSRPVLELTNDDFDSMMNLNCKSVLYGMQVCLPYFKENRKGHVINVSSLLSRLPHTASMRSMYSASKAAMNSLTCNARGDLRAEGFTANEIQVSLFIPGVVATDFGLNAVHGGPDNRKFPWAQPVDEVAEAIADLMINRQPEVYSRSSYKKLVVDYYSAEDASVIESAPPFGQPPASAKR